MKSYSTVSILLFNASFWLLSITASAASLTIDCDTIITTEGKTYICEIQQHNSREITFSLCDDTSGKTYSIPTERLASVHKLNMSAKVYEHLNTPPRKKTTHKNGAWVLLDATELFKKGTSVAYERQLGPKTSYLFDVGMRWHDISPTGHLTYDYEEVVVSKFLSPKKTYYNPAKPKDLGSFLPTHTTTVGASMRFYLKGVNKFSLFFQPGLALFYHNGYKVTENLTFISSTIYQEDNGSWINLGPTTKTTNWRLERDVRERTTRLNLSISSTIGYRLTSQKNLTIDFGMTMGRNFKGVDNDIRYYGIKSYYVRGFIQAGWKIR